MTRGGPTQATPFPHCRVTRTNGSVYEGRIEQRDQQHLWFISTDEQTEFRADLQARVIEQKGQDA